MKTIVLTGIAHGLGNWLYRLLYKTNCLIIGIDKIEVGIIKPSVAKVKIIKMDLSKQTLNLKLIENNFNNQTEEIVFINNAGIIDPIDKVGKIDDHSIIKSNFVNFLSSIRIANKLKIIANHMGISLQIINITTGAANKPYAGWSMYCSTKCGVKMFYDCMTIEDPTIIVRHIDPGIMDTNIQKLIRQTTTDQFPLRNQFAEYKKKNLLKKPENVAQEILAQIGLI